MIVALDSLENQFSSYSAIAMDASARVYGFLLNGTGRVSILGSPAQLGAANPSEFSIGWSNPDSSRPLAVLDRKTPSGFNGFDIFVRNGLSSNRIHNLYEFFVKNHLRSYPESVDNICDGKSNQTINNGVTLPIIVENGLRQVQAVKEKSTNSPTEISLRLKNNCLAHQPTISRFNTLTKENS